MSRVVIDQAVDFIAFERTVWPAVRWRLATPPRRTGAPKWPILRAAEIPFTHAANSANREKGAGI